VRLGTEDSAEGRDSNDATKMARLLTEDSPNSA
jgi:hypothetical protein